LPCSGEITYALFYEALDFVAAPFQGAAFKTKKFLNVNFRPALLIVSIYLFLAAGPMPLYPWQKKVLSLYFSCIQ
jgi:hypothetical protein